MLDQFENLDQKILGELNSFIPSPASEAGPLPLDWRDGPKIERSGPGAAPANPSLWPANGKESTTSGICGPISSALSASAARRQLWESKLRQRMAAYGSPEYVLTWKHWDMKSGPPICALRASARRISDKDSIGWPTPNVPNGGKSPKYGMTTTGMTTTGMTTTGMTPDGKKRQVGLEMISKVMGWPTPREQDCRGERMETRIARKARCSPFPGLRSG